MSDRIEQAEKNLQAARESVAREEQALAMRGKGAPYMEIGAQLGITTTEAHELVDEALKAAGLDSRPSATDYLAARHSEDDTVEYATGGILPDRDSHGKLASKYRTEIFQAQKKLDEIMDAATITEERTGATIRQDIEYADGSAQISTRMAGPDDEPKRDLASDVIAQIANWGKTILHSDDVVSAGTVLMDLNEFVRNHPNVQALQEIRADGDRLQEAYEEEHENVVNVNVTADRVKAEQEEDDHIIISDEEEDGPSLHLITNENGLGTIGVFTYFEHEGEAFEVETYFSLRPAVHAALCRQLSPKVKAGLAENSPAEGPEPDPSGTRNHIHVPGIKGGPLRIDGNPIKVVANGVTINNMANHQALTTVTLEIMPDLITIDGDLAPEVSDDE